MSVHTCLLGRTDEKVPHPALTWSQNLEFGYVALAPRCQKDRLLIESVLRQVRKIVPGLRELDYGERLKCVNLPHMN